MTAPFHLIHLVSLFLLFGITFSAFADPSPERRKKILMFGGICSLGAFLAGFALLGYLSIGFPNWILVKLLCWFILSGLAGIAFRKKDKIPMLQGIAILVVVVAVSMVYFRPF